MNQKMNVTIGLSVLVVLAMLPAGAGGRTVYVDASAGFGNNGTSWAEAHKYLQDALTEARLPPWDVTEILVAEGSYFPDQDDANPGGSQLRSASFDMVNGVSIYGGYPTGGGVRNPAAHPTILSADLWRDDNPDTYANYGNNSYHVVTSSDIGTEVILFGLIIRGGNADGAADEDKVGGGIYSSNSILTLVRCNVEVSLADGGGGGMYNDGGEQTLVNCRFSNNRTVNGGGIYNKNCTQTLINCLFYLNGAGTGYGGGICCADSVDLRMVNCTLDGNGADGDGSGLAATASQEEDKNFIRIHNSILWNYSFVNELSNTNNISEMTVTYSDVRTHGGVWPGEGNINEFPNFDIDHTLDDDSACIDAGNNDEILADTVDLDGDSYRAEQTPLDLGELVRRMDRQATVDTGNGVAPVVDMGAHEFFGMAIIYVDAYASGTQDGKSWQNAYKYLQDALTGAIPPAIIYVAQGTYSPDKHIAGDTDDPQETFQLRDNTRIFGGFAGVQGASPDKRDIEEYETILDGLVDFVNGVHSYHVVTGSGTDWSAVLEGFTITNGKANGADNDDKRGGGMYNDAGSPTVRRCKFLQNHAMTDGGGMYNCNNSNPKVTSCVFLENSANSGGGMANLGSGLTITNCKFIDNHANVSGGGGIRNFPGSSPTITNCTFSGNLASNGPGGGMDSDSSTQVVTNCTFTCNSALGRGGGMRALACTTALNNSILWNNNTSSGNGAQLAVIGSVANISYCDLEGGIAGVYTSGGTTINDSHIMDEDPLFVDGDGEDDICGNEDDDLRLSDDSPCVDAADNTKAPADTIDLDGDGDIEELTPLDIDMYPRFMDPLPVGGTGNSLPPDYVDIADMGAYEYLEFDVIYVDSSATGAEDGTSWEDAYRDLQDAFAREAWAVRIYVAQGTYRPDEYAGGDTDEQSETFRLRRNMRIYGGYAGVQGADPDERDIEAYETSLSGWISGDPELYCYHVVTASDTDKTTIFDGFTIKFGIANGPALEDKFGGGMYCMEGNPTITDCKFLQNRAELEGGGIYCYESSPVLTRCTFITNWAGDTGGGMSNGSLSHMTMTDCDFIENSSDAGGGLTNANNEPTITNCSFQGNTAATDGGAMVCSDNSAIITGCTFTDNLAGDEGGAVFNVSSRSPTLKGCTFTGNQADKGGAIYRNGNGVAVTKNCTFINNVAASDGGGVYTYDSFSRMVNCVFLGNAATAGDGGAMRNHWSLISSHSDTSLTNCVLSGNSAGGDGGAIYDWRTNSTLNNCTFGCNTAGGNGGAMYLANTQGIETTINNCILWGGTPQQIFGGAILNIYHCDLEGGIGGIMGALTINHSDVIDEDPLFVDADGADDICGTEDDNLRLSDGTPCVDAGDDTAVPPDVADLDDDGDTGEQTPLDLDRSQRFADGDCDGTVTVDMGAYEPIFMHPGDFNRDCRVDLFDLSIFASAWLTEPGDPLWNPLCDIGIPADDRIDARDLCVLAENWRWAGF